MIDLRELDTTVANFILGEDTVEISMICIDDFTQIIENYGYNLIDFKLNPESFEIIYSSCNDNYSEIILTINMWTGKTKIRRK